METVAVTASTNADLKRRASDDETGEGLWLRAERQSGGKGRLGRTWDSPEGNLYCSTIVEITPTDPMAASLSLVTALAVHDLLTDQLGADTIMALKWPNDVLVEGAKICGILLERVGDKVIVGIGLNVAHAPELPDRETISIHAANDHNDHDAAQILEYLIPYFEQRVVQWRTMGLSHILHDWDRRAHKPGSALTVSDGAGERQSGKYAGLTATGALRLRKANGTLIEIHAGDVEISTRASADRTN